MRAVWLGILLLTPSVFADVVKSVSVRGTKVRVDLATQVGQPYDSATIEKDVRELWRTGRFSDIRVARSQEADGVAVIFQITESQTQPLHRIRLEPSTYGLQLTLPEGTPINSVRAHDVARQARDELRAQGFQNAEVDYKIVPYVGKQVDLHLTVHPGDRIRVNELNFIGDVALDPKELRGALQALRVKRVLPAIPGLWGGWRLFPSYSPDAVQSDLVHLQSLYLSKGYLDASLRMDDLNVHEHQADITIRVQAGPLYRVRNATLDEGSFNTESPVGFCPRLLAARRDSERQGILDFAAKLDARRVQEPGQMVDLSTTINRGRPYRVGRINFVGSRHYSDGMLRRNFLIDEGQLLDERLLRKSIARLNQTMLFDPVSERDVQVHTDELSGLADISIQLREHKGRSWNLSGPVGPASFAGPLVASLRSRLPSWGSGLLELSMYSAAISLYAFAPPLVPVLSAVPKRPFLPILALQRPFLPGEGWKSGFYIAPQLGWRALGVGYSITQIQQRVLPLLAGDRGLVPELPVTIITAKGEAQMFCEPPKPRLVPLRMSASIAIRFLGVLAGL